jgi:hypothetical protein
MDIKPSQSDIDDLAAKLDQLSEVLTAEEVALLLAIFSIAGQSIAANAKPVAPAPEPKPKEAQLPKLSAAFKAAFKAGTTGTYSLGGESEMASSVSVGGSCVTWTE